MCDALKTMFKLFKKREPEFAETEVVVALKMTLDDACGEDKELYAEIWDTFLQKLDDLRELKQPN
jgi:hypothetical protein